LKLLIAVVGPTASGKTNFAIELAQRFETEIISADARQVYRELNIGTAKPTPQQLATVKHHFVSCQSVSQVFDAGSFEQQALEVIRELFEKKDVVVLAGGSGLFVQAVCEGFDDIIPIDESVRENVIADFKQRGILFLQQELKSVDPDYFERVDTQNPMRLMRAVEVFRASGKPYSSFRGNKAKKRDFAITKIGLDLPREQLYERINKRVDAMIKAGLEQEVRELQVYKDLIPLKTLGYTEFFDYFDGKISLPTCIELIKRNSRRYAKRQLSWFRRDVQTKWLTNRGIDLFFDNIDFLDQKKFKILIENLAKKN
jgi:tRNA dimethylallyltransferase